MVDIKQVTSSFNDTLQRPLTNIVVREHSSLMKSVLMVLIYIAVFCYLMLLYVWFSGNLDVGVRLLAAPSYFGFLKKNVTKGWDKKADGTYIIPKANEYMQKDSKFFKNYDDFTKSPFMSRFDTRSPGSAALSMGQRDNVGLVESSGGCGYNASDAAEAESIYRQGFSSVFSE